MPLEKKHSSVQDIAREFGVGGLHHHILLCRGPNCCTLERGEAVWKYLKDRLKTLGLSGRNGCVYRTKVDCMRICQDGPIAVVYPEGAWYHQVDEAKIERIIQSHCTEGKSLENETFATHPLPSAKSKQKP